jgi:hypothetical protein
LRRILSISRRGIDAVKAIVGTSEKPLERIPAHRTITYLPEFVSLSSSAAVLPPRPAKRQDNSNDDLMGLKNICDAIGLDPNEIAGEPALRDVFDPNPRGPNPRGLDPRDSDPRDSDPRGSGNAVNPRETARFTEPAPNIGVREPFAAVAPPSLPERSRFAVSTASDLADVLASLKLRLLKIRLAPDDLAEAEAEIETAIAQLLSPRPKLPIITASLTTLLSIVEQARAATLTRDIEASLTKLRTFLRHPDL